MQFRLRAFLVLYGVGRLANHIVCLFDLPIFDSQEVCRISISSDYRLSYKNDVLLCADETTRCIQRHHLEIVRTCEEYLLVLST